MLNPKPFFDYMTVISPETGADIKPVEAAWSLNKIASSIILSDQFLGVDYSWYRNNDYIGRSSTTKSGAPRTLTNSSSDATLFQANATELATDPGSAKTKFKGAAIPATIFLDLVHQCLVDMWARQASRNVENDFKELETLSHWRSSTDGKLTYKIDLVFRSLRIGGRATEYRDIVDDLLIMLELPASLNTFRGLDSDFLVGQVKIAELSIYTESRRGVSNVDSNTSGQDGSASGVPSSDDLSTAVQSGGFAFIPIATPGVAVS